MLVLAGLMALVATGARPTPAGAAPVGAGFNLNASDLKFILQQIKIAENHAAGNPIRGTGPNQVEDPTLPFGLRTVDGTDNNLQPGQRRFGASDSAFPRLVPGRFDPAEAWTSDPDGPGPINVGDGTSYAQRKGLVNDSQPRVISNLIVDQTASNPAAVAAAGPGATPTASGAFSIPNVAPDVGLSAPYNSWFTLFGQFFDHGLDLTSKSGGTVFTPLKPDDPLYNAASPTNFMVLTRATNQPGPDGVVGDDASTTADESADDVQNASNQTTPFVDQSQTYTSHPSHQVFLREYENNAAGKPVATGKMLDGLGPEGGMATWAAVKQQAKSLLGIQLVDADVLSIPLLATDAYGRFERGPNGYPQMVGPNNTLVEGDPAADAGNGVLVPSNSLRTGHAFLDDIAHHAVPKAGLTPDADTTQTTDDHVATTYDNEMLDAHFTAGDGRTNENIGLSAVHAVFHSEHNRLVGSIQDLITTQNIDLGEWRPGGVWNGERIFQAAKFVTEMEYQHLVFEEFAHKVQPQVNLFAGYDTSVNPAIQAEFAHSVYRFGHSMLTESVDRVNPDKTRNDIPLLDALLNPPSFTDGGTAGTLTPEQATGSIVRGMTRQVGNELDEFVTEALRNRLLGLPLDLATLNLARGRDTGVPRLNAARKSFYAATRDAALKRYSSWADFGLAIRHPESLVNFVAAYGQHPSVLNADTAAQKRAAAKLIVEQGVDAPADSAAFLGSTGSWTTDPTGLDSVDLWVGGLAEKQQPFGGLLGNTFNYVFETQMENLQDGDRFYYLARTGGLNLLTQLEGNSFAELIERNSDASGLPADVFSRPDLVFDLSAQAADGPIVDDLDTEVDERTVLIRTPDGTVRFNGPEHVVFNGSLRADKVWSSEGDDTLRGNDNADRLEGAAGNDNFIGGDGDDVLTDSFGDDVLMGGDGHDAMASGQGFDLNQGGLGKDFVVSGSDPTETFGGPGDDFVFAGQSSDTVFGDDGNDWIQGGGQADLLQGDNGAPFQNDSNEPGNDVITGEGGNDDYDAEGGDDIMVAGPGIERNEGLLGFDWAIHQGDPQAANDDMNITGLLPPTLENNRDRFDFTEGMSGWTKDDILRGDDADATTMVGHELTTAAQLDRIAGLQTFLGATSFTGGNIIVGGAGSDPLEGRGGDDRIDGDRWLRVQLKAPDASTTGPTDSKLVDSMGELQDDVFDGKISAGDITIVRTLETAPPSSDPTRPDLDTAVFSGLRSEYTIDRGATEVTVTHDNAGIDGIDRLTNVERLQFADQLVELGNIPTNTPPAGAVTISDTTPAENQALTATDTITDADGIASAITYSWESETAPDVWATVATGTSFTPGDLEVARALRVVATYTDGDGVLESVTSAPTAAVTNVNDAPTGTPAVTDTTPQEDVPLSATTAGIAGIADNDGPAALEFRFQWQQSALGGGGAFTNIADATGQSLTPGQAQVNRALRVVVSYTDQHGTIESLTTAQTGVTGDLFVGTAGADTWTGTAGDDRASGAGGNDTLNAGAGNDELAGNAGDDTVNAGAGDDGVRFTGTADGFDAVTGNGGADRIEATQNGTVIGLRSTATVEQTTGGVFTGVLVRGSELADTLSFSTVTLSGIVEINGGGGNDSLTGSTSGDTIRGGAGNDTINSGNGPDVVSGDAGDDTLNTGGADDVVQFGGTGEGFDTVAGGAGTDLIEATQNTTNIGLRATPTVESITAAGRTGVRIVGSDAANTLNLSAVTLTDEHRGHRRGRRKRPHHRQRRGQRHHRGDRQRHPQRRGGQRRAPLHDRLQRRHRERVRREPDWRAGHVGPPPARDHGKTRRTQNAHK